MKRWAILWMISAVFSLFLAGLFGWVSMLHHDYENIPSEYLIGNKVAHTKVLKGEGFPFSFLVIGDTEGSERGEFLIKKALEHGKFSFMVIVGDFVKKPDIWEHRYFLKEMSTEIKPSFPVFLVPGNHDIDYTSVKINDRARKVTPEVFDSLYGARNFDFTFNHCLFILSEVDPKNPNGYLNYLQEVLSKKGKGSKHIFVFIHYPPKEVEKEPEGPLPNEDEFFSLVEAYRVKTCFFGHYHGYWRGERNGVNLIVIGGGGRLKKRQPEWGKFHHILKVDVDEHIIKENLITLKESFAFEDSFEKRVFTQVFPIVQDKGWILYAGTIIFLSWGICSFIFFTIILRNKKPKKE